MTGDWFDYSLLANSGFPSQQFPANAWIFMQEDAGDCMFIVRSGEVQIVSNGTVLEVIGPNGIMGEMSLIDGAPRSASARTAAPTELVALDRAAFLGLVRTNPEFALQIMHSLAMRIRRLTETA